MPAPKKIKLTAQNIPTLPVGKYGDPHCPNLTLWVRLTTAGGIGRYWLFRGTQEGKPVVVSLGPVNAVTQQQARVMVANLRSTARTAQPLKVAKPVAPVKISFRDDAVAYHTREKPTWSEQHAKYWLQSMELHTFPKIGAKDTGAVTVEDIVSVLEPIWTAQHETAIRIHGRIKATIDHAMKLRPVRFPTRINPADSALTWLPKVKRVEQVSHASIPWCKAPNLYETLAATEGQPAKALRFLMLTGTPRANEVIGARWSEIEGNVWHVPGDRMKSAKARDIPLSDAAMALLVSIDSPRDGYVFTGRKGKVIGGTVYGRKRERTGGTYVAFKGTMQHDAMQNLLRDDLKIACHVHGLRSTFRTWASDHATTVRDHDAAEICLDHVIGGKVQRAYDRADMMPERRELLERWAAFLGA